MVYIGDRLRQLRMRRGLSQVKLAAAARLAPGTIFEIENNRSEPRPETIEKLAAALDVPPADLLED